MECDRGDFSYYRGDHNNFDYNNPVVPYQNVTMGSNCPSGGSVPCQIPDKPRQEVTPPVRPDRLLAYMNLPCQMVTNFDYGECYSYYANGCYNTCQFVQMGDIEDFMNNEKRKEKSRDAARSRRSRETEIFTDLAKALPLNSEQISQLDKASIMRLTISYFRVRDMVKLVSDSFQFNRKGDKDGPIFLKSLEGFILVLSCEGDFVYLSENVSDYLGISQVDLIGQNVFEYSHPCDHDEIREILSPKTQEECETPKSVFIRLKCTLTSKGRSVNLKSATYKVIHCTGHVVKPKVEKKEKEQKDSVQSCLVAVGQPIPHPSNIDTPLPRQTFLTKHSLDMKFTHADDEFMMDVLGYTPDDLIGKSVYDYHHAMDSDAIGSAYKCLFSKGQCETNRYRFLVKTGGFVWVVTQATLIYDKMQKPQSVVCVNYVISGVECKDEIYSAQQYLSFKSEKSNTKPVDVVVPVPEIVLTEVENLNNNNDKNISNNNKVVENSPRPKPISVTAKLLSNYDHRDQEIVRPHTATKKIFAPRTKEMSKGFLTFSDEEPGVTMLKDEPEDLTHLAPVAGDVCVPLDESNPCFFSDLVDDFLLQDANFSPMLTQEPADPFISYRNFRDTSPQLLSPNLSKSSESSLPSLCSPSDSLIDEDQMSTFISINMDEDPELIMKAPYIPMDMMSDDILMSDDFMWNSSEKNNKSSISEPNSHLAQLLSTSSLSKHSIKINDHGGGLNQDQEIEEMYEKSSKSWNTKSNTTKPIIDKLERSSIKRSNGTTYDHQSKRTRNEPKEKMSSELLQQLMSNNHNRGRPKGKSNWLLDSGGQKAACISQPSDSVLMNLLDKPQPHDVRNTKPLSPPTLRKLDLYNQRRIQQQQLEKEKSEAARRNLIRKNSLSLLDPDATGLTSLSLLNLTPQDYDVNAPVNSSLLQGEELLKALEVNTPM